MKPRTKKTIFITVIVAAVFAVSGVVAFASSTNISSLEDLYLTFRTAQVEKAVDNGDMTSDDAQAYLDKLTERMEVDETDAVPPLRGQAKGGGMIAPKTSMVELYSEVSGLSVDEVKDACSDDTSIFAIADKAGLLDGLKAVMIEQANERIDEFVANGRITEDKATELKAASEEKINSITADTKMPVKGDRSGMEGKSFGNGQGNRQCPVTP